MNDNIENALVEVDPTLVPVTPGEGETPSEEGQIFVVEDAAYHAA